MRPRGSKLKTLEEVDAWVAEARTADFEIGFTCGTFDILHAGHADYLAEAARRCDLLLVAVNSDASVRAYKSPLRPLNSETDRMQVVAALESVDAVTLMEDTRPGSLLARWRPDVYLKGGDYLPGQLQSAEVVQSYGGRVEIVPLRFEVSTTQVFERAAALALHAEPVRVVRQVSHLALVDRDGTIIRDEPFVRDPALVALAPGAGEGLRTLQDAGFTITVITNQQGLGLGYFDYADFVAVNAQMFRLLGEFGVRVARVYFCPHTLADGCGCRKPGAELVLRAMAEFRVEPKDCILVGDRGTDMEAAARAGVRGVLVPATGWDPDVIRMITAAPEQ